MERSMPTGNAVDPQVLPLADQAKLDCATICLAAVPAAPFKPAASRSIREDLSMSRRRLASNRPSFALKHVVSLPRYPTFKLQAPQAGLSTPTLPVTPLDQIIGIPSHPPPINAFTFMNARCELVYPSSPTAELPPLRLPRRLSYSASYMGIPTPTTPHSDGIYMALASPADIETCAPDDPDRIPSDSI